MQSFNSRASAQPILTNFAAVYKSFAIQPPPQQASPPEDAQSQGCVCLAGSVGLELPLTPESCPALVNLSAPYSGKHQIFDIETISLEAKASGEFRLSFMAALSLIVRSLVIALWVTAGVGAWVNCAAATGGQAVDLVVSTHEQDGDEEHCEVECLTQFSGSPSYRHSAPALDDVDDSDFPRALIRFWTVSLLSDEPVTTIQWSSGETPQQAALHDLATVRLLI